MPLSLEEPIGKNGAAIKICGNVVALLQGGDGDLVRCGEDKQLVSESEAKGFLTGLPKIDVI